MQQLLAALESLSAAQTWTVVALSYELGYLLEPRTAPPGWQPGKTPLATFWRFSACEHLTAAEFAPWLTAQAGAGGILGVQPGLSENAYISAVDRIRDYIFAGDCYQVNFTFPLRFQWFGTPLALYARLRERQPVSFGGFIGDAGSGIVSLSPELFVERRGDVLHTRPMKGTAPRHQAAESLANSAKDRAENLMIVDLLRNDLGRVAQSGGVKVDELFTIEDYPTVWQMVSSISAKLPAGCSFGDILLALFPCGSITGAPKIRATQIAAELEVAPRGIYTGALGWLAPNGDFRLNVAIRTLALQSDHQGSMGLGSGIVADSRGEAEWQECLLKGRFLTDCDPGILLIETLRREDGRYPSLSGHLARLQRSAEALHFPLDIDLVRSKLDAAPASGRWRVRLTLGKTGLVDVQCFPLTDEPGGRRYALLGTQAIRSDYPLRQHKTSDRAIYDVALREIAAQQEIFDVVFLNERGEVAEGARSTVFVERDGRWLTPPLSSGALPGVLRAEMLRSGRAEEAVLHPVDLADGFWLGNALRGLIRVSLRST